VACIVAAAAIAVAGCDAGRPAQSDTITIGYSAWPGWFPWAVAADRNLFAAHEVSVEVRYFDNYTDSLNALSSGAIDANSQTLNDTLVSVSAGAKQRIVLVNDNSTGNDQVICAGDIHGVADLKGKRIAVEKGTVDHYLLLLALQQAGLGPADVLIDPLSTSDAAKAFAAGNVDCAAVFAPFTTVALARPGSAAVATSAEFPGAVPDHLVFRADVVTQHPDEVQAIVDTWFDTIKWIKDNPAAAAEIMARRAGVTVSEYQAYEAGTSIFTRQQNVDAFSPGTTPDHLNAQANIIADFMTDVGLVAARPSFAEVLDPRFVKAA
jgi:NitT/TauT family transport system substrate-binding protein